MCLCLCVCVFVCVSVCVRLYSSVYVGGTCDGQPCIAQRHRLGGHHLQAQECQCSCVAFEKECQTTRSGSLLALRKKGGLQRAGRLSWLVAMDARMRGALSYLREKSSFFELPSLIRE